MLRLCPPKSAPLPLPTEPYALIPQVNPEAFHTVVAPYLDQHLLELYRNGTSPGLDAPADSGPVRAGSLRGSGSMASEAPGPPADAFANAFKQGVGFVVPIVI